MKIALVAPSGVPFVVGGAEKLWWGLTQHVNQHTPHEMELVKLPSPERNFWEIAQSYERFSQLDLSHFDGVISTKYPAWMVSHPNHVVYLQHRLRGLYDTWPSRLPLTPPKLPDTVRPLWRLLQQTETSRAALPEIFERVRELQRYQEQGAAWVSELTALPGPLVRALVHKLDAIALAPGAVRSYLAISQVVAQRENYFPAGVAVEVLPHPSNLEGLHGGPAEFVFTASRLDSPKRIDLLVKAYRQCQAQLPLCIAGEGPESAHLQELAAGDPRIRFVGRLTDTELVEHYSRAAVVPFVPEQEDMGLITLEAMAAGKPVLTVNDAGGVTEFVQDGINGRVVAPEVRAVAQALDAMLANPVQLAAMGQAALQTATSVTWDNTAQRLLAAVAKGLQPVKPTGTANPPTFSALPRQTNRLRLLVLNTFGVYPPDSGGKKRVFYLYQALAEQLDVTLLNLGHGDSAPEIRHFSPHYREVRVAPSVAFARREATLTKQLQRPVTDIAALLHGTELTEFCGAFAHLALEADVVVAAHVYFGPLIQSLWQGPVWYDAHNVEADIKADVLGVPRLAPAEVRTPGAWPNSIPHGLKQADAARLAITLVAAAEQRLVQDAQRVLCVSEMDRLRLAELYGRPTTDMVVAPNGTAVPADAWLDAPRRQALKQALGLADWPLALFVGAYHGPNLDAVDAVVRMAEECPAWCFAVVGSVGQHLAQRQLPRNLYVLGLVSEAELTTLLRTADVGLNPMLQGSGTNLKILDYAGHGALVVSSPTGARGLALVADEHYLEREVADFAATLQGLTTQTPAPYHEMRARARRQIELSYDWGVIAAGLLEH